MRKMVLLLMLVSIAAFGLTGCTGVAAPVSNGLIFTNVDGPVAATMSDNYSKVGESSCSAILGLISTGDASINAAMKAGNIRKIHHVDHNSMSILGIYAKFTTVVYGD